MAAKHLGILGTENMKIVETQINGNVSFCLMSHQKKILATYEVCQLSATNFYNFDSKTFAISNNLEKILLIWKQLRRIFEKV